MCESMTDINFPGSINGVVWGSRKFRAYHLEGFKKIEICYLDMIFPMHCPRYFPIQKHSSPFTVYELYTMHTCWKFPPKLLLTVHTLAVLLRTFTGTFLARA